MPAIEDTLHGSPNQTADYMYFYMQSISVTGTAWQCFTCLLASIVWYKGLWVWTKPASHYWCKLGFEGRYKHLDCNRRCSYLKKLKKRQSITMLQRCNCIKQFFRKHFRSNWSWKDLLHSSSHIFWFWKAFLKYWEPENHYKYIQAIGYEQRPAIYFTKISQEPENIQVIQKGCRMGVTGNQDQDLMK